MIINETQYSSSSSFKNKMELREIFGTLIFSNARFHEYLKQEFPQSDVVFNGNTISISHVDRLNYLNKINNAISNFISTMNIKNKYKVTSTSCAYNAFFINDYLYIEI